MHAVIEAARNVACSGAKPLAVTNNLNFGNPEKLEIMGQIVGTIEGIKKTCEILEAPIVSGNVSLYNETNGKSILPTPVIGMIGIIHDIEKIIHKNAKTNQTLFVIGQNELIDDGWLGCSLYQEVFYDKNDGKVPNINISQEKKIIDFLLYLNSKGLIEAAHDISDGFYFQILSEMLF